MSLLMLFVTLYFFFFFLLYLSSLLPNSSDQSGGYMWLYGYDVNTGAQLSNTSVPLLCEFNPNNEQSLNGIVS